MILAKHLTFADFTSICQHTNDVNISLIRGFGKICESDGWGVGWGGCPWSFSSFSFMENSLLGTVSTMQSDFGKHIWESFYIKNFSALVTLRMQMYWIISPWNIWVDFHKIFPCPLPPRECMLIRTQVQARTYLTFKTSEAINSCHRDSIWLQQICPLVMSRNYWELKNKSRSV